METVCRVNIYTGLMRPLASGTPSEPYIPITCSTPACSPMLRADTHFGSVYPIYLTANGAKQFNCSFGHTLAETVPTVKLNLDSVDCLGREMKWAGVRGMEEYSPNCTNLCTRERKLNCDNCLIASMREAGGYLAAPDRQML